jgi:FlgD Ig-like domain
MKRNFDFLPARVLLVLIPIVFSTADLLGAAAFANTHESGVLSAAGAPASSRNFRGNGTLGQSTPIGVNQHPDRTLSAGFWYGWWRLSDPSDVPIPRDLVNLLMQNHPNPFNPQTTIRFVVAQRSPVDLELFDLRGRLIKVLIRGSQPAGNYQVFWDGTDSADRPVPSGTYFYRLRIGDFTATKKMLLLK